MRDIFRENSIVDFRTHNGAEELLKTRPIVDVGRDSFYVSLLGLH